MYQVMGVSLQQLHHRCVVDLTKRCARAEKERSGPVAECDTRVAGSLRLEKSRDDRAFCLSAADRPVLRSSEGISGHACVCDGSNKKK